MSELLENNMLTGKDVRNIKKTFSLQQDQRDCGVACLLSIIRYYKGDNSLEKLRELSGTNIYGTSLLGLYQAANALGFEAEGCEGDMQALISHGRPLILHTTLEGNLNHYVVCYGTTMSNGKMCFVVGDPGKGVEIIEEKRIDELWKSRACLTLVATPACKTIGTGERKKMQWIYGFIKNDIQVLAISAALGLGIAVLNMSMALFSQRLIDDIIPEKAYTRFYTGIALLVLLLFAKDCFSLLRQYFLLRQGRDFNNRVIRHFYTNLLHLPKPFFDTRKIGELTARLNDTSRIQRVISQLTGNLVIDLLVTLAAMIFLFVFSPTVGYLVLCCLPIYFWLIFRFHKPIVDNYRKVMSGYALNESNYISTLQGIEAIKNFDKMHNFSQLNEKVYGKFQDKLLQLGTIQVRLTFLVNVLAAICLISILGIAAYKVLTGELKTGEMMAILGISGTLFPAVANMALVSIPINEARVAFDRMFDFTVMQAEENPIAGNAEAYPVFQKLSIENMSFCFPGRLNLLSGISLEVKRGEVIALIGENGSGKSTFAQILQRFYFPNNGRITINNGIDIRDIPLKQWRNIVANVPQQPHIFNATILENIAFEDATNNTSDVMAFLDKYGFMCFFTTMPQGVFTLVGEEGINLSGGQKQLLALARAFYHRPQLLILDEATSAMDRFMEQFVLDLVQSAKKDMAVIFITHRLHSLKIISDRIYLLENGTISTKGDHDGLLKTDNLYSAYWANVK
jgi:ATP-binding cassette, subfamily C, bacteriocin exporter